MRRAALVVAAALGCSSPAAPPRRPGAPPVDPDKDQVLGDDDLARDLEATVLEGYSQLTLGNLDAYADLLAEETAVIVMRAGPKQVWVGQRPSEPGKYLRIDPCVAIFTKNLEV